MRKQLKRQPNMKNSICRMSSLRSTSLHDRNLFFHHDCFLCQRKCTVNLLDTFSFLNSWIKHLQFCYNTTHSTIPKLSACSLNLDHTKAFKAKQAPRFLVCKARLEVIQFHRAQLTNNFPGLKFIVSIQYMQGIPLTSPFQYIALKLLSNFKKL